MKDLNQCNFIGRLGRDAEIRFMANGTAVTNFSIAVGNSWKDKESGDTKEHTEWVRCVAYDKLAEICGEYLKTGKQVMVTGEMRSRKFTDKEGVERWITEIRLTNMQMLSDPKGKASEPPPAEPTTAKRPVNTKAKELAEMDDDIPF